MEPYIPISYLNDFIFCPRSIYFHRLHGSLEQEMYHTDIQIEGKFAHQTIDQKTYSTKKDLLVGVDVYCEKYNLYGKIDVYDVESKKLIERKNNVKKIYDGYVFQLYAQTFALREMGYEVKEIVIYDKSHNVNYPIPLPEDDPKMFWKFEKLIEDINSFDLNTKNIKVNAEKCKSCIYSHICDCCIC